MTGEQRAAFAQIRGLAEPMRFRVKPDDEGYPVIAAKLGHVEWTGDGDLAVYTNRRRLFEKLWAIPGVKRHQTGDTEMRALFPPEALEQIAGVIRAKHKRSGPSPNSLANLRPRAGSGIQNRRFGPGPGQRPDGQ